MSKNVMQDFDYDTYENLLNAALDDGVHIVHSHFYRGGYTFVWQRSNEYPSCKMIEVAVSFCSTKDQYVKKIGAFNALNNFYEGKTILLPVGSKDSAEIVRKLRTVFTFAESF